MARVLTISDGTLTVDLLAMLAEDGFTFNTDTELVWTVVKLVDEDTSANLRSTQADLDTLFEQAKEYIADPNENNPVWFYWQSEGESAKRHLVYDGSTQLMAEQGVFDPLLGNGAIVLQIAIQHEPDSENTSVSTVTQNTVSNTGGAWAIASQGGTRNGRISVLSITSNSVTPLTKMWIGMRKTRNGTAGFIGKWEAESGTIVDVAPTGDTSQVSDGTASGSSKIQTTFTNDPTLKRRFTVRWDQIQTSGNWDDLVGTYLVLCRCKVDNANTEVAIELRHGWAGFAGAETPVGKTFISGQTNWLLVELGQVQIPPTGNRDGVATTGNEIKNYFLSIYAERLSVSGSLDIDCFVIIPVEYLVTVNGANLHSSSGPMAFYTGPDGFKYALGKTATGGLFGNVEASFEAGLEDWEFPRAGALLVFAGNGSTSHILTPTVNFSMSIIPHWRTYRDT